MAKSRKEINHNYYIRSIKPFRSDKGVAERQRIRCFLCGHWIDFYKYLEKTPNVKVEIKLWKFGGRANISTEDFKEIPVELKREIRNILASKFKEILLRLDVETGSFQGIIETPIGTQPYEINNNSNVETQLSSNVETQLNPQMEVKYGN